MDKHDETPPPEQQSTDQFDWLSGDTIAPAHALDLDKLLWSGLADLALPRLRALMEHGPAMERAVAGWVLARWELDRQETRRALEAIQTFHAHPEGLSVVPHAGPFLLAIQLGLATGNRQFAASMMEAAQERFGETPDLALAQLSFAVHDNASAAQMSAALRELYAGTELAPVSVSDGEGTLFDRLHAKAGPAEQAENLPMVSVIVPVFNGGQELQTALRSLQQQSWQNLEVLVVDDGSIDDSVEIAQHLAAEDPRIKVLLPGGNNGAYPARNFGFAQARGEFVTVHDADDWSHPQKIEMQARALIQDPNLPATVSHWVRAGNSLEMTRWRMEEGWIYRNVSSLMLRATLRETLGFWDRAKVNADTEYYYRILQVHGLGSIREVLPGVPLAFGRTLPTSLTSRSATHMRTQYHGVRHDYMEAAHYWHQSSGNAQDLFLPQHPDARPFNMPSEISLGDPPAALGDHDRLKESPLLDERWYFQANPDVLAANMGAARHYLVAGAREGRDPGPGFSSSGYRMAAGLAQDENPLLHFLQEPTADPLPAFAGKLEDGENEARTVLVFAHTSGETLFGAERSLLDVIRRLSRKGQRPVVVLPALRNPAYFEQLLEISAGVEIVPQLWRSGLHPVSAHTVDAMRSVIRKHRPREVHVNTIVQEAPLLAARAEGVPSIVYVREMPAEDPALCRSLGIGPDALRRQLLEQADSFVMPSRVVQDWLGCPERSTVRPNAVDEALFDLPFSPGRFLNVALISSNITKKGVGDCVEVARMVAQTGRAMRFLLIGPQTNDLLRLQPFPTNVQFRDYAPSPVEAIGQADIVLSLSHFAESFGRTVLEAMAAGRPVVCYDRGAPPTLVESGKSGFVVPADSPSGVANALLALDAARLQLDKFSASARTRAREIQDQALA